MSEPDPRYGMSLDTLEDIFQRIIVPDYLLRNDPKPQTAPEAIWLGGQPGAGKTTTAAALRHEFADRGGLVWVTRDDLRPFHSDYERLIREQPERMPDITRPATQWWQDRSAEFLRAGRCNVLLEMAFRDPDAIVARSAQFHQAGYKVQVAAVATPAYLSRLSIIERYARQVQAAGAGRWVTEASHTADYAGTREVLQQAEADHAVSRITLWDRGGTVYDNHRQADRGGMWRDLACAVDVLDRARDVRPDPAQAAELSAHLAGTVRQLDEAGAAHQPLRDMAAVVGRDLELYAQLGAAFQVGREPGATPEAPQADAGIEAEPEP